MLPQLHWDISSCSFSWTLQNPTLALFLFHRHDKILLVPVLFLFHRNLRGKCKNYFEKKIFFRQLTPIDVRQFGFSQQKNKKYIFSLSTD
jgi:hypothetical protein